MERTTFRSQDTGRIGPSCATMACVDRAARRQLLAGMAVAALLGGCSGTGDGGTAGTGTRPPSPASPAVTATTAPGLDPLPVPRTEVAGAAWAGDLVVAGGLTLDGGASALVHVYDAGGGGWEEGPPLPVPLHHAGMAVLGDRVFVAGGYTNGPGEAWVPQAAVRSLGRGEVGWRDEAPLPGGPRGALGLAATGNLVVAAGGESGGRALARTEIYDPEARTWRPGPDLARPREHLAVAAVGDRVYAIAGRAPGEGNFTTVESVDPGGAGGWRAEPDLADARGGIGAAAVDGRLCVAGGEEEAGTIASVECLDGGRWTRATRMARPRHGLAVMARDGRLHLVAGGERPGLFVSGVHEALDV